MMMQSGMSVARLNFSHGTQAEHAEKIRRIREASEELQKPVAILQDLCGPKIRVGKVAEPGIRIEPGQTFILTSESVEGINNRVSISYPDLPQEVKKDDIILLADGMMELLVKDVNQTDIYCDVLTGGVLTSYKGINLPSGTIKTSALTEKDRKDLMFGLEHGVDYVALSFVREAQDLLLIKSLIKKAGKKTPVIAKIEKHEALVNIDEIMALSDGIMVARGDLGVEIPLENVPKIQKMLIRKANTAGKPVIVATQMLRSMLDSPRPTRAEATDVANAVLDGSDAIMLSEETATGHYPVKAVQFMSRIAKSAEECYPHQKYLKVMSQKGISESVAYTSCILADNLCAAAIVATTRSGFTAQQISRFKPKSNIIALSPDKQTINQLALFWGCTPRLVNEPKDTDDMIEKTKAAALAGGTVKKGDIIVITAGHPVWTAGTTSMLKIETL
jgi:pyruvate kinase